VPARPPGLGPARVAGYGRLPAPLPPTRDSGPISAPGIH
jgi:hypothetical protein